MPTSRLQRGELVLQRLAQLGVERAERLVEQEHRRLQHERAGERDPLLLTARELRGLAVRQTFEAHQRDRVADPALAIGLAHAACCHRRPYAMLSSTVRCGKSA